VACRDLGISLSTLKKCVLAAGQAAFLTGQVRDELVSSLKKELKAPGK
jgi:hypothetical protein